jgi:hypothetical protein
MGKTFASATLRVSATGSLASSATTDYLAICVAASVAGIAALVGALWLATTRSAGSSLTETWLAPVEIGCKVNRAHGLAACPECVAASWNGEPCRTSHRHWQPAS